MHISHRVTSLEAALHYMQLPLKPQKGLYYSFHECRSTPQDLNTLQCEKTGGVTR